MTTPTQQKRNKPDPGNDPEGVSRVIDAFSSPSPDPGRSSKNQAPMSRLSTYTEGARQTALGHWILSFALVAVCNFLIVSCSGGSGSWDDDAKNWSRAFAGQQQPPDVKVAHSRYWKSPHFTYEAEYFFEFTTSREFLDAWITGQKLVPTPATKKNTPHYFKKPDWFTPKDLGDYDMWLPADDPHSKFRIYRDRSTGTLFVTDCST